VQERRREQVKVKVGKRNGRGRVKQICSLRYEGITTVAMCLVREGEGGLDSNNELKRLMKYG
jgi:hypothetical protein